MRSTLRALCPNDDKRHILEGGVHTLALGHYMIKHFFSRAFDNDMFIQSLKNRKKLILFFFNFKKCSY